MASDGEKLPPVVGELQLNIDQFDAALDEAKQKLEEFSGLRAEATLSVDAEDARATIDDISGKLDEIDGKDATATVTADADEAVEKIDDLQTRLDELDAQPSELTVTADTDEAEGKLDELQGRMTELDGQDSNITVTADTSEAEAKIDELEAKKVATTGGSGGDNTIHIGGDTSGADGALSSLGSAITDNMGKAAMLAAAVPAAFVAIGGAAAALPGMLAGATAGVGALAMGFHGILGALEAYSTAQLDAGQTSAQMAMQASSSAQQIEQAQSQVAEASRAVAQAQEQAAYSVAQAQQQEADAYMQAGDTMRSANEQVTQSEQQLQEAESQERQAQVALTEARQQAAFQLQDYQDQLKDGALQIQQDQANVQQAQLNLNEVMGDPSATALQRQQAELAYEEAKQQLQDEQDQYGQLQTTAAEASKKGVDGADAVVSAQQALQQAQYGVQDAAQASSDAQTNLAQQQVLTTQQVSDAQANLAQTIYTTNNAVLSATQQQAQAEQALAFALQQAGLSAAASSNANTLLAQALAKLSPAGQQFVAWVETNFIPVFKGMEQQVQGQLLPGIEQGLSSLLPLIEAWGPVLDAAAKGFDTFFQALAGFMGSKQGLSEFNATMQSGLGFMDQLGGAIVNFVKGLGALGSVGGPALSVIGGAIDHIASHFATWASSGGPIGIIHEFVSLAPQLGQVLNSQVGPALALWKVFGPLGFLVGLFRQQLAPLISPALQFADAALRILQADLTPFFAKLGPILGQILRAVQPLLAPFGHLVESFLMGLLPAVSMLVPIIRTLAPPLTDIMNVLSSMMPVLAPLAAGWFLVDAALDANPITIILVALVGLGVAIDELVRHWSTIWGDIKRVFLDAYHMIDQALHKIPGPILAIVAPILFLALHWKQVWGDMQKVAKDAWDFIDSDLIQPIVGFFTKTIPSVFSSGLKFFTDLPGNIESALSGAASWLLDAGENIIKGLWHGVTAAWSAVGNFGNWLWHQVTDGVSDAVSWLANIGWNILMGLWNGLVSAYNSIGSFANHFFTWVTGEIGDATQWLLNVGWNVLIGLWNGMVNGVDWVGKHIGQIGSDIVHGFESFFGIGSPSKLFAEKGLNLMQGLARGIADNGNLPLAELMKLSHQVSQQQLHAMNLGNYEASQAALLAGSGGGTGSAGGGGGTPFVVELDGRKVGQGIMPYISNPMLTELQQRIRRQPLGLTTRLGSGG